MNIAPVKNYIPNNEAKLDDRMRKLKRFLDTPEQKKADVKDIATQSFEYAKTVRESAAKAKETKRTVKKIRYNGNSLSSSIITAKNSLVAKQAASKARKEVIRLKKDLLNSSYDSDEVNAAIEHAKSMERIARKKAYHLRMEEEIKVVEDSDESGLKPEEAQTDADIEEFTNELMDFEDELLKDELEFLDIYRREMNEEDFNKLKTKHRTDELKELDKANREYLKFLVGKLEASQKESMSPTESATAATSVGVSVGESIGIDVSI